MKDRRHSCTDMTIHVYLGLQSPFRTHSATYGQNVQSRSLPLSRSLTGNEVISPGFTLDSGKVRDPSQTRLRLGDSTDKGLDSLASSRSSCCLSPRPHVYIHSTQKTSRPVTYDTHILPTDHLRRSDDPY